jgi:hypothetical protein
MGVASALFQEGDGFYKNGLDLFGGAFDFTDRFVCLDVHEDDHLLHIFECAIFAMPRYQTECHAAILKAVIGVDFTDAIGVSFKIGVAQGGPPCDLILGQEVLQIGKLFSLLPVQGFSIVMIAFGITMIGAIVGGTMGKIVE